MSVNTGHYGAPLPPLTADELAAIGADILRMQARYGFHTRKARRWRWRRFVVANGGKGLRGAEREAFLRTSDIITRFDAVEAARPTLPLPNHQGWRMPADDAQARRTA